MRRLVVGAALVLALAGCGGDPNADPTTRPSGPVTTPASTTPSPPAMPEAAKADTSAGAIAFVRYYVSVFNHAQATGSTDNLKALSSARCVDCEAAINGLSDIYGAGGQIIGGSLLPGPGTAEENKAEHVWLVLVRIDSSPQTVTTATGAEPTELPGGRRSMEFSLIRTAGSWKVASWKRA